MGALLGFFMSPTSVLAPIAAAALAFGLGAGLGYVRGFDGAVAKYQVASLKAENEGLRKAIIGSQNQLTADRELAEAQEKSRAELEAEIERASHVPSNRTDVCRFTSGELQYIRDTIARSR